MAKKSAKPDGKSLVIVESPAKARTISKYLGRDFVVEASIGHVRDLPRGAKEIPAQYKGEVWAYLGVNTDKDFDPIYIVPPDKTKQVKKLKDALKGAKDLYLATDEDREGEAISWHLAELLKPKVPVRRLVFHEITKEAILGALANPRDIDTALVQAQEARRIIDRLYGYEVSPLLWRKVRPKLSAGRVQSVAVRMIVARERERMAFTSATYWDLVATLGRATGEAFDATLVSVDGRRIPSGRDFDPATGKIKNAELLLLDESGAKSLAERLLREPFRVTSLDEKPYTTRPYAPFTTSTLQQEANRKLGFTARRAMQAAQSLYENGHITYMRTDSTNLAQVAIDAARDLVATQYGREYLPDAPRQYRSTVKNAQEAHEAIRPAGHLALPETLRGKLKEDEFRLYDLIWKRTIASQMADCRGRRIMIAIEANGAVFQVSGKAIDFAGYLRAYVEGSDDPEAELADRETTLPHVAEGESLACRNLDPKSHTTQPPARFTEAALTQALEEKGIGRPSTYASIIDTILYRNYVFKKGTALVPTWVAMSVSQLLESHLPALVDYAFTAQMEDDLDSISRGETRTADYLRQFYFGNGQPGLKKQLDHKIEEIDARAACSIPLGSPPGGTNGPVIVRVGKFGPYLEYGDRRASIPEDMPPDELTIERSLEMLEQSQRTEAPLGNCPETGKPVFVRIGRFGPYVQRGTPDDEEKPKNASLLKGMKPEEIDLAMALSLLSLPRTLGPHPQTGEPVVAQNGRFGPYIKCGAETRSLREGLSPLDVTMEQALELLAQPKTRGRGAAKKTVLAALGDSPDTGQPVQLLDGRYGPYVSDGVTNASLSKGTEPQGFSLEQAMELLRERALKGPAPKKGRSRRSAASRNGAAAAKKTARKKTPRKAAKRRRSTVKA